MKSGSTTVTTSLATTTSSEFSTKTSTPTTSLDQDDGGRPELQTQVRILRRYRASSSSPPRPKRRATATMNGGTRRPSPRTGGRADGVHGIVDADCTGARSLPASPLMRTCATTTANTTADVATTTVTVSAVKTSTATDKSSLLVVTQTSRNSCRSSYSTFGSRLDVCLPTDGLSQPSTTVGDCRPDTKTQMFRKSSKSLVLNIDAAGVAATAGQRWKSRRRAVVGSPQTAQTASELRLQRVRRCVGCLKSFVAFLFSTIGLTILLIGYTIIGGFIFRFIEAPYEVRHF